MKGEALLNFEREKLAQQYYHLKEKKIVKTLNLLIPSFPFNLNPLTQNKSLERGLFNGVIGLRISNREIKGYHDNS